jgi:hypothetical protein
LKKGDKMIDRIQELYKKEMLEDIGIKCPCKRFNFFNMGWTNEYVMWLEASLMIANDEIKRLKDELKNVETKKTRSR